MKAQIEVDDLTALINILPYSISSYLKASEDTPQLIEIVLDLGRPAEVRFSQVVKRLVDLGDVTQAHLDEMLGKIGEFNLDNRAGIERTLHRISAIRNRQGKIIGLTCRIGRAVLGTIDIIKDIIESGQNCLMLGPPGIGKTTLLRETARVLADEANKRVVVVDTSNEIAGDGDIPHPGIGFARRMQVHSPNEQHAVMIEAVENHMPEVIIVDEIGTEQETRAARTIAERGVQLVATAHGYNLENLINNPVLSHLVGGIQSVIIGDEEAKFRGTNKSILERKSAPTFDVVIEIRARDVFAVYNPVALFIDAHLKNDPLDPELRTRQSGGNVTIVNQAVAVEQEEIPAGHSEVVMIYPYGMSPEKILGSAKDLEVNVRIAHDIGEADLVLTTKRHMRAKSKLQEMMRGRGIPLHVIKTEDDCAGFLRHQFHIIETKSEREEEAYIECKHACEMVLSESRIIELLPQDESIRQKQHQLAREAGLNSMSVGEEPRRRVRIFPKGTR